MESEGFPTPVSKESAERGMEHQALSGKPKVSGLQNVSSTENADFTDTSLAVGS